jgi:predicted DsbA family dithiol-disulfide isomerase
MHVKITYYLDVTSSWCFWAEPAWDELRKRFNKHMEFNWKIAQLTPDAMSKSREQCDWFYRRSGTIVRASTKLNSGWFELDPMPYVAPNAMAEAARDFGVTDDRVRLALARAALRDGRKVGRWEESAAVAAPIVGKDASSLIARAKSPEIAARIKASTDEFFSFQVKQRPAFVIENNIGDRAIFSGLITIPPLGATIEAMWHDASAYESYAAHHGPPPET